jgi:hypothetical protein
MRQGETGANPPYPGLRPFNRDEANFFFGRDDCVESMVQTIEETRFLAVLGPSGSGKSSLVRSGLFLHLEAGMARKAGARWTFLDIKHPRQAPYRELAIELLRAERRRDAAKAGGVPDPRELTLDDEAKIEERRKALRRNPRTLVNWWREHRAGPDENLLLLVDQFEELFGYGQDSERDDIEAFVDLLLESIRDNNVPVYVITTMRAEFLGGCTLFAGLSEQINRSLSLLPRMLREDCREAITEPVDRDFVELDPELVTTLLNDMNDLAPWKDEDEAEPEGRASTSDPTQALLRQTDLIARRADQLPLMQHVLNWMWTSKASKRSGPDEPIALTLKDYLKLEGLQGALSKHATKVMDSTGDPALTERIFRALTDQPVVSSMGSAESSAVRRPRTIRQLAEETAADENRVGKIVEAFRAEGVSMLTPGGDRKLTSDTEVDISHESLIRQWADLRGWIRDEAERGRNWRELVRNVDGEDGKPAPVLRGLELADRRRWWREKQPQPGWAERYEGRHYEVDRLIARSVRAERWRKGVLYGVTGSLVLLASVAGIATLVNWQAAKAASIEASRSEAEAASAQGAKLAAIRTLDRARVQAAAAQAETISARRLAVEARLSAAVARQAQRAADARVTQANAALAAAQAEGAAVRLAANQARESLGQLYENRIRPNIRSLPFRSRSRALEARADIGGLLPLLETPLVDQFRMGNLELSVQDASEAVYNLDAHRALDAAGTVEAAAAASPALASLTLLRSEASIQTGRARLMMREYAPSDSAFLEAIRLAEMSPAATADTRFAVAAAQHGRALVRLEWAEEGQARAVHRGEASAAADACVREANTAMPLIESDRENAAARQAELAWRLLKVQCLVAGAAAIDDDLQALSRLEAAAGEILNVRDADEQALPSFSIARSNLFTAAARRMAMIQRAGALTGAPLRIDSLDRLWNEAQIGWPVIDRLPEDYIPMFGSLYRGEVLEQAVMLTEYTRMRLPDYSPLFPPDRFLRRADVFFQMLAREDYADNPVTALHVADALAQHNQVRLDLVQAARRGADFPAATVLDAVHSIITYELFLAKLPAGSAEARLAASHRLAQSLLEGLDLTRVRYPQSSDLPVAISQLGVATCRPDSAVARTTECAALIGARDAALSLIMAQARRLAELTDEARRQGPPVPVNLWTDDRGIALAGYDPLTCDVLASLARTGRMPRDASNPDAAPAAAAGASPAAEDSRSWSLVPCRLRRGYYQFAAAINGRVWLFENEANLRTFRRGRRSYAPELGGYDTLAMSAMQVRPIEGEAYGGVSPGGRLYLFRSNADLGSVRRGVRNAAEGVWGPNGRPPDAVRPLQGNR